MRRPRLRGVRLLGRGCDFWVGGAIDTSLGGCDFWVGWYSIGGVRLLGRGCDFWVGDGVCVGQRAKLGGVLEKGSNGV